MPAFSNLLAVSFLCSMQNYFTSYRLIFGNTKFADKQLFSFLGGLSAGMFVLFISLQNGSLSAT